MRLPEDGKPDTVQVWFDADRTPYFYWSIPEAQGITAMGLIAEDRQGAEESLGTFLKERGLEAIEFQSAVVPMHRFELTGNVQTSGRNVFIVGDAAAQVKVTTVGGVVTGLYGAKVLAHTLLRGGDYRKELSNLKVELDLHLLLRKVLNRFNNEDYDRLIDLLGGDLKRIFEERTRDELKQSFLEMIWTEPRLITLGAKAFLRSIL